MKIGINAYRTARKRLTYTVATFESRSHRGVNVYICSPSFGVADVYEWAMTILHSIDIPHDPTTHDVAIFIGEPADVEDVMRVHDGSLCVLDTPALPKQTVVASIKL